MDEKKPQKYMNPITLEAEMFLNSLENLSKKHCDAVLVSTLEKVMIAIETFVESNPTEILATESTKLMTCDNISYIKRIYHCTRCKTDLGKSVEKATLHVIDQCIKHVSCEVPAANVGKECRNTAEKKLGKENIVRERKSKQGASSSKNAVKLTKKTCSLLITDMSLLANHLRIGKKLQILPEYDIIESDLMALTTPLFPDQNVKIYKFGSRFAGIGTRESDLDLYIDIGDTFNIFQNRASDETLAKLRKVKTALTRCGRSWKIVIMVHKARVPILKVLHRSSGIECDINFSNSLGFVNTKLLDYLFDLQPIARLLCIFFKKWLHRTGLNDELSTYSLILMIIFYLQIHKVLPALERLQENVNPEKCLKVGPWFCSYATLTLNELNIPLEDTKEQNVLKFVREFFVFYTKYNFCTDVVCSYLGKSVKKSDLETLMPERYKDYVANSANSSLELDKSIIVQDPIELNHNTTKGLLFPTVILVMAYMEKSLEYINNAFQF